MESDEFIQENAEEKVDISSNDKAEKGWKAIEARILEAWEETGNDLW